MDTLKAFAHLDIDWNLTPEDAVTMYLEWGNNDCKGEFPPVRSKSDVSRYFVVDTWGEAPVVRLVERNSEKAVDLVTVPLPESLLADFYKENGNIKGIVGVSGPVKAWLQKEMD